MKTRKILISLAVTLIATAITISGCCVCCWGCRGQEKFERTEQLSAPMAGIEQIKVDTSFGSVTVIGSNTTESKVITKITGNAPTKEEAKQLAEQTKITLEPQGKILVFRVDKPHLKKNRNIGVAYDIAVPTKTGIDCKTSFGTIKLKNITEDVVARTSFGEIDAENIVGKMHLDTSHGQVDCENITSGDFWAKTSFGKVKISFSDACPADMKVKIETSFGEIEADIPASFAGDITVGTSFGGIRTDLPITVKGEIGKTRLKGTIGAGAGSLDLKTSFGNVLIK
ncbi:MAG: DUF4097 family beta strand repeat protein [Sedimentisphaerales bacterium]|nr:DUF4097 family beta strand repeat protein [Sedimentisphaerales bacterium]